MKPTTFLERFQQAEATYHSVREQFASNNFLDWVIEDKLPSGEIRERKFSDLIPPYCRRYTTMLGFIFSGISPAEVPRVLDGHFPGLDRIDLDYVRDVIQEIDDIVSSNYSFSPNSPSGVDYYNGFRGGLAMEDAGLAGQLTDNSLMRRVLPNVERARQWVATYETTIDRTFTSSNVSLVAGSDDESNADDISVFELPGLKWKGKGADLAEVIYRLAKAGLIDLREYRVPNGKNMSGLCRHICQLFQVSENKREAAAKNLKANLSKFAPEDLEPGPVDELVIFKVLERKPGNAASAKIAATLPLPPVGEA